MYTQSTSFPCRPHPSLHQVTPLPPSLRPHSQTTSQTTMSLIHTHLVTAIYTDIRTELAVLSTFTLNTGLKYTFSHNFQSVKALCLLITKHPPSYTNILVYQQNSDQSVRAWQQSKHYNNSTRYHAGAQTGGHNWVGSPVERSKAVDSGELGCATCHDMSGSTDNGWQNSGGLWPILPSPWICTPDQPTWLCAVPSGTPHIHICSVLVITLLLLWHQHPCGHDPMADFRRLGIWHQTAPVT